MASPLVVDLAFEICVALAAANLLSSQLVGLFYCTRHYSLFDSLPSGNT